MKIKATYRPRAMWDDHYECEYHIGSCEVFASDKPLVSPVLGPDGAPLEYEYQTLGFDLRPVLK